MFDLSCGEWFMCRVWHSLCSHPSAEGRQFPFSQLQSDFNTFEQHFATSQLEANRAPVSSLHKCDMETWNLQHTKWHNLYIHRFCLKNLCDVVLRNLSVFLRKQNNKTLVYQCFVDQLLSHYNILLTKMFGYSGCDHCHFWLRYIKKMHITQY